MSVRDIFIRRNGVTKIINYTGYSDSSLENFDYTYTGRSRIQDNVVQFLTSGTLTITKMPRTSTKFQLFLVGGGGAGAEGGYYLDSDVYDRETTYTTRYGYLGGNGGGGGYTSLVSAVPLELNVAYPIIIGAGGNDSDGEDTKITIGDTVYKAEGGKQGGNGGSGGGASSSNGGVNGGNGSSFTFISPYGNVTVTKNGGTGENESKGIRAFGTRAFYESKGNPYGCGGGGGAHWSVVDNACGEKGIGSYGAGSGGSSNHSLLGSDHNGTDAVANTGAGGGGGDGGRYYTSYQRYQSGEGGKGGSGILLLRIKK